MKENCFFVDTAFVQALLNKNDSYHQIAKSYFPRFKSAKELWITEAVLTEIGNALSENYRAVAIQFIEKCYLLPNMHVVTVDDELFKHALILYKSRTDKNWGLTDCISFVVMTKQGLHLALTTDHHFIQAGFQALLIE